MATVSAKDTVAFIYQLNGKYSYDLNLKTEV